MARDQKKDYAAEVGAAVASAAQSADGAQSGTAAQTPQAAQQTTAAQAVPQTTATAQLQSASAPQPLDGLRTLASRSASAPLAHADASGIRDYLEQSRDAAIEEAYGRVDRGVTEGVNELARVREDAEDQYRTQQDQVSLDERRALDNKALYMAMNGMSKSGVGVEQYGAIQNAAAQNRLTINNARTKLQTDVARQMAEIRATGDFEKSQAYLQATQEYLSQIAQLEQWLQEFNVSVDQFNAQMEESRRNYLLQLKQLELATDQWEREFAANRADALWNQNFQQQQADLTQNRWQQEFDANRADTRWNQSFQQRQADLTQSRWQQEFNANRSDTAWNQSFQQRQADLTQNRWQQEFNANRSDTAWNQNFQQGQAETARNQWQQEFDANRADTAWNQNFQQGQAETARNQWQQEFDANRADTRWSQNFQQGQADRAQEQWQQEFDANRADTSWNQLFQQGQRDFQQRQYADTLADKAKQDALSRAEAMMNIGMTPDEDTLKAAGLSKEYAQLYISAVKAAKDLSDAQAAAELENKQADTLKKVAEASQKATAADASGSLDALAQAFIASGSDSPKTWLANNYKSYGFSTKPDAEEFADAVDEIRENTPNPVKDAHVDFSPDEGIIKFDGKEFRTAELFAIYVNSHALTESDWETLMRGINRWPELKAALRLEDVA